MRTVDYLEQIQRYDILITNGAEEIIRLETMATSITKAIDNERIQSSGEKDRLGKAVAQIVDTENEILLLIQSRMEYRREIVSRIEDMANVNYYNVLYLKYVKGLDMQSVADEMGYSYSHAKRILYKAIEEFEKRYGIEYKSRKGLKRPKKETK